MKYVSWAPCDHLPGSSCGSLLDAHSRGDRLSLGCGVPWAFLAVVLELRPVIGKAFREERPMNNGASGTFTTCTGELNSHL